MEKKAKAEAKRLRRIKRKQGGGESDSPETPGVESDIADIESGISGVELETPKESN